jgi:hypothetical protein
MNITGEALIGGVAVKGTGSAIRAYDPSKGEQLEPAFGQLKVLRDKMAGTWRRRGGVLSNT